MEKVLQWHLSTIWQCVLVTVLLPYTGCSGMLVYKILFAFSYVVAN